MDTNLIAVLVLIGLVLLAVWLNTDGSYDRAKEFKGGVGCLVMLGVALVALMGLFAYCSKPRTPSLNTHNSAPTKYPTQTPPKKRSNRY
jgi:hypothetical protein